jgi:hypothetical protein
MIEIGVKQRERDERERDERERERKKKNWCGRVGMVTRGIMDFSQLPHQH